LRRLEISRVYVETVNDEVSLFFSFVFLGVLGESRLAVYRY